MTYAENLATSKGLALRWKSLLSDITLTNLTYSVESGDEPTNGRVIQREGTDLFIYVPDTGFTGVDTLMVTVRQSGAVVEEHTWNITVDDIGDNAFLGGNLIGSCNENHKAYGRVAILPGSSAIGQVTYCKSSDPENGIATVDYRNGIWRYVPKPNWYGTDTFKVGVADYKGHGFLRDVVVTVHASVDPTVVSGDTTAEKPKNNVISGSLTPNAGVTDVSYAITGTPPSNGSVVINSSTGDWDYTPNQAYIGLDTFEVTVTEDGSPQVTDVVVYARRIPIFSGRRAFEVTSLDPIASSIAINDPEAFSGSVTYTVHNSDAAGTFTIDSNTGDWTYTPTYIPAPGTYGEEFVMIAVSDGSVTEFFTIFFYTPEEEQYYVTVSGGQFYIEGEAAPTIFASAAVPIRFVQDDASNTGHPLRIYTDATKTTQITDGVTIVGTPGTTGAYTVFKPETAGTVSYQCANHSAMGGDIEIVSFAAAIDNYGWISTGRGGTNQNGPNDLNPTRIRLLDNTYAVSDLELYIPSVSTVLPYDSNLPAPWQFDSTGDVFNGVDYEIQIRVAATSDVLFTFEVPLGDNTRIFWA